MGVRVGGSELDRQEGQNVSWHPPLMGGWVSG